MIFRGFRQFREFREIDLAELSTKMRRQIRKEIEYRGINLAKLVQGKINNQNLFEISNL